MDNIEIPPKAFFRKDCQKKPQSKSMTLQSFHWAEKHNPELFISLFLGTMAYGGFFSFISSGIALLIGGGFFKALGAFMVFGVVGMYWGLRRGAAEIRELHQSWVAEHPDKA